MSDENEQPQRGFYWLSRAWYGPAKLSHRPDLADQIMLGIFLTNRGGHYHPAFTWRNFTDGTTGARFHTYHDAWRIFRDCPELFAALAELHKTNPAPEEIAALLVRLGFVDMTPHEGD